MTNLRHKKFRKLNPKYRNKHRKNNYMKSKQERRKNKEWTEEECKLILLRGIFNDRSKAMILGRSVQAIQQKRYLIKKETST